MKRTGVKRSALDFVASNGGEATHAEILTHLLQQRFPNQNITAEFRRSHRGYYSSYFSGNKMNLFELRRWTNPVTGETESDRGLLLKPTLQDPRYLEKVGEKYVLRTAELNS